MQALSPGDAGQIRKVSGSQGTVENSTEYGDPAKIWEEHVLGKVKLQGRREQGTGSEGWGVWT